VYYTKPEPLLSKWNQFRCTQ